MDLLLLGLPATREVLAPADDGADCVPDQDTGSRTKGTAEEAQGRAFEGAFREKSGGITMKCADEDEAWLEWRENVSCDHCSMELKCHETGKCFHSPEVEILTLAEFLLK